MAGACAEAKLDAPPSVVYRDKDSGRKTLHYKVNVDRGVTWKRSLEILENALAEHKEIENHRLKRMEANGSKGNSRRWRSIIEPSYFVTKHSFQGKYFVLLAQEKFESVVNRLIILTSYPAISKRSHLISIQCSIPSLETLCCAGGLKLENVNKADKLFLKSTVG